jgi:hypothetical protein
MLHDRQLARIQARLDRRCAMLEEGWRRARTPDRFLAVERLLRSKRMKESEVAKLDELNRLVQHVWNDLRLKRKQLATGDRAKDAFDELERFALEAELERSELRRDRYIDESGLADELFSCAETFLIDRVVGEPTYADMCVERQRIKDELAAALTMRSPVASGPNVRVDTRITRKTAVIYSLSGDISAAA